MCCSLSISLYKDLTVYLKCSVIRLTKTCMYPLTFPTQLRHFKETVPESPEDQHPPDMTGEAICFHLLCSLFDWLHLSIGSWCWQSFNKPLPGVNSEHVFVEGQQRGELMRSTVRGSREFSVKCQWNVKCLSKTLSAFCGLAGGLASLSCVLDYSELEEGSLYISAPQQPSFRRPAGTYTTLPHKHTQGDKHTI